ncbi:Solvent efflux pump srpABC operon corepressor [Pseudomonas aeruginosa]|nr:Solvent efflux pump srpABC operon corepressor [Pseudomonas aeruginosa]
MARKPRAEMIEETRAKLIDAARRAFADNGYAGASMDELTASAGLTRGCITTSATRKACWPRWCSRSTTR